MGTDFFNLIKIEKFPHYGILKNSSQIQCQNAKIQMFNSSLIRISMFASEHLVYQKTMW
jgi:hypothetical protein